MRIDVFDGIWMRKSMVDVSVVDISVIWTAPFPLFLLFTFRYGTGVS